MKIAGHRNRRKKIKKRRHRETIPRPEERPGNGLYHDDSAALEAATAGCQCPDKKHGPATRKCKHQLTAIISTNVQRQLAGDEAEEIEALPASETTGDSPFTRMKARDARANAQTQLEAASAAPVHTPERDDDGMLWS